MRKLTGNHDVYMFLTHAILHCQWGSEATDRNPTDADLQAARILTHLRNLVVQESSLWQAAQGQGRES